MTERIKNLFPSLVGSSIEFNFGKKVACAIPITQNIQSAKERISRDVEEALAVGGELCVMLLSELTFFYRTEPYYMAVRSSIEMRRYRPAVLAYMNLSVDERACRLKEALSERLHGDKNRHLKVAALKYFVTTYPSRISDFRKFLTKEEYYFVV